VPEQSLSSPASSKQGIGDEPRPVRFGNYVSTAVLNAANARRARAGSDFVPVVFMIDARWF